MLPSFKYVVLSRSRATGANAQRITAHQRIFSASADVAGDKYC